MARCGLLSYPNFNQVCASTRRNRHKAIAIQKLLVREAADFIYLVSKQAQITACHCRVDITKRRVDITKRQPQESAHFMCKQVCNGKVVLYLFLHIAALL